MERIKAAVVGLGYWGPNLARNFQASDDYSLVALCDLDAKRLSRVGESYTWSKCYTSLGELLKEAKPDIVAVCTPVAHHYAPTKMALEAGCHVLCEKPLAATANEAAELVGLAARCKKNLFVDHTFTYTAAVRTVRNLHAQEQLGELFYVDSVRINLGLFQPDVDVIWDLAPHDISILKYVIGRPVRAVQASGWSHNPRKLVDVAYVTVEYDGGATAHLHLSWLSPVKVRRMIFSGSKSSVLYDDVEMSEKIRVYDQGVSFDVSDLEARKQVLVNYRRGDMRAPALDNKEALATEVREIAAHLRGTGKAVTVGEDGLEVVRILEACEKSLASGGGRVTLSS